MHNKRMLSDWFYAALQTSRKCGRYVFSASIMLITIARYSFPHEAHIAKAKLESVEIPAFIADEHTINMQWLYSNAMGGVRLQVPREYVAEAQSTLNEDFSESIEIGQESTQPVCAACGGALTEPYQVGRRPAIISWLLLGLPLWPVKHEQKCTVCGVVSKT